jgi:hypothetical protein
MKQVEMWPRSGGPSIRVNQNKVTEMERKGWKASAPSTKKTSSKKTDAAAIPEIKES